MKTIRSMFFVNFFFLASLSSYAHEPFLKAVKSGDLAAVTQWMIEDNGLIQCVDSDGSSPLDLAIQSQNVEMVSVLISGGADVSRFGSRGLTPLMAAAELGNKAIVEKLIRGPDFDGELTHYSFRGAEINEEVIDRARASGHSSLAEYLEELRIARKSLLQAAGEGDSGRIQALSSQHPRLAYGYEAGFRSLIEALHLCDYDVAGALINAGAEITKEVLDWDRWSRFGNDVSIVQVYRNGKVLQRLIKAKDLAKVKSLLAVDPMLLYYIPDGESPLNVAVESENEEVVRLLIQKGIDVRNTGKVSALSIAVQIGNKSIVKELVGVLCGRDLIPGNVKGAVISDEVIQKARTHGHGTIADYLIEIRDRRKALFTAVRDGNLDLVRQWIDQNGDVNFRDETGSYALMEAFKHDRLEIGKALVAAGVTITDELIEEAAKSSEGGSDSKSDNDEKHQQGLAAYLVEMSNRRSELLNAMANSSLTPLNQEHIEKVDRNVNFFEDARPLYTPLSVAIYDGENNVLSPEMIKMLVKAGAIPTQALVDLAMKRKKENLAQILIDLTYGEQGLSSVIQDYTVPSDSVLPLVLAQLISNYVTGISVPKAPHRQPESSGQNVPSAGLDSDREEKLP